MMRKSFRTFLIMLMPLSLSFNYLMAQSKGTIRVGAKHFNEGYILGEVIALLLEDAGYLVDRRFNLGGTAVIFEALRNQEIDVYPEYSGTISFEILKSKKALTLDQQRALVKTRFGLEISEPIGFNNTYALVMKPEKATELNISKISDLKAHPELQIGLSYEFLKRQDGWDNLVYQYQLPQNPRGLEHGLAYQAIANNNIELTDAYSTDGEIDHYGLLTLEDDKNFFPTYQAVSFFSERLPAEAKAILESLSASISEQEMQHMNYLALFQNKSHYEIAYNFLTAKNMIQTQGKVVSSPVAEIFAKTLTHIKLTFLALIIAILIALPLGIFIYRYQSFSRTVLYIAGIMQTIPSIALLALMIPLFGIGFMPAIVALFIYALLPILRNTVIGLFSVDPVLKKVALAMGLSSWDSLKLVELPLATPSILTGIRTAAVINVGTATLAAFIGAGGLGEFIVTGLALNNIDLILMGAVPAALLAIAIEILFELLEWWLIPGHLRQKI
jgi:osmoprotectant transport system permease protein